MPGTRRQLPRSRGVPLAAVAATLLVAVVIALWQVGRLHGHLLDDAFITFRYARNFGDGHGWHYNPGHTTTNAATSVLWTSTLGVTSRLTGSVVGSAQILFALCVAGTATLLVESFRRLGYTTTSGLADA